MALRFLSVAALTLTLSTVAAQAGLCTAGLEAAAARRFAVPNKAVSVVLLDGRTVSTEAVIEIDGQHWVKMQTGAWRSQPWSAADHMAAYREQRRNVTDCRIEGRGSLDGVPAYVFVSQTTIAGAPSTIYDWISVETRLPLQTQIHADGPGIEGGMTTTYDYKDIRAPDPADTAPLATAEPPPATQDAPPDEAACRPRSGFFGFRPKNTCVDPPPGTRQ